jgi:hypothetical protein
MRRPVSHAGSGRLAELADRLGLSRALGQFAGSGGRARRPKPARVLCDLILKCLPTVIARTPAKGRLRWQSGVVI